jgi:hypothetical protein
MGSIPGSGHNVVEHFTSISKGRIFLNLLFKSHWAKKNKFKLTYRHPDLVQNLVVNFMVQKEGGNKEK